MASQVNPAQGGAAWGAMCLLGACVLFPYNCLLTAQPYFDLHAFKGMGFPFTSMLVYSGCLCVLQLGLTFGGESLTLRTRVGVALGSSVCASAALLTCAVLAHAWPNSTAVYAACLGFVALLAFSNSLLQTAVLGVAGAMGPRFSAAVMVGLGLSGLLSLGLSLLVQVGEKLVPHGVSEQSGEAGVIVAVALFACCIAYSLVSLWLFFSFLSRRERLASGVIADLETQREVRREESRLSLASRRSSASRPLASPAESPNLAACTEEAPAGNSSTNGDDSSTWKRALLALREVAPQAINVAAVFVTTMCIFPGVLSQWQPGPGSAFRGSRQLFGTLLIGAFQVCDVLSRLAAGWGARNIPPSRLWMFVLLRLLFVPAFILGELRPEACPLWGSDVGRFLLAGGLAFTNGLFASLAMMFGPARCPEERREVAGIAMSSTMVVGIFLGSLLALLLQVLLTHSL